MDRFVPGVFFCRVCRFSSMAERRLRCRSLRSLCARFTEEQAFLEKPKSLTLQTLTLEVWIFFVFSFSGSGPETNGTAMVRIDHVPYPRTCFRLNFSATKFPAVRNLSLPSPQVANIPEPVGTNE